LKETAADARILLAEKGLAHETVQVDLRTNEQLGEAYRLINPLCTVPALRSEEGLLPDRQRCDSGVYRCAVPGAIAFGRDAGRTRRGRQLELAH